MAKKSKSNTLGIESLADAVLRADPRAIARAISLFEDAHPCASNLKEALKKRSPSNDIRILGITGSPGAGKSTLVDSLALAWTAREEKVAILAVDPSSPFTGGAVLGDRIRMSQSMAKEGIYIRSLATRGALGGLSPASFESAYVLSCAGYTRLIIETVGVGQSEIDIMRIADCCALLLVPGMGDVVQSLKAGIMEIAHIFVLNKADREGVELLEKEILNLIALGSSIKAATAPNPKIVRTIATKSEGIEKLIEAIEDHFHWLESDDAKDAQQSLIVQRAFRIAQESLQKEIRLLLNQEISRSATETKKGFLAAQELAEKVLQKIKNKKM